MTQIILASQSPRRKELLAAMGVVFETIPSNFDEQLDESRPSEEVAVELALGKAHEVAERYPDAIVIGSDTIVALGDRQLGKPADEAEAWQMWHDITEKPNRIISSVVVVCKARAIDLTAYEVASVYFKPFDEAAIKTYLDTGDYKDKAGAYGVQSGAAPLIERIEGNFDTIMGLPTQSLASMLVSLDIDCQPVAPVVPVLGE